MVLGLGCSGILIGALNMYFSAEVGGWEEILLCLIVTRQDT